MFLNEILQLDKTISSIRKIDQFLAQCDKTSKDYYMAFAYRTLVLHAIGKTNEALKLLYTQISNLQILPDEGILALCDAIIEITMDVGRLDQTKNTWKSNGGICRYRNHIVIRRIVSAWRTHRRNINRLFD